MTQIISKLAPVMGATSQGASWALKALHPSDASVSVSGIPDKSAVPSVMINYQSTSRYGAPSGILTPTWNFAATMFPHPVAFGVATNVSDDGLSVGNFTPFLNQQLVGSDHGAKAFDFLENVERWRLAYMGVSIHFDGPALSNQGSIAICQAPFTPREYSLCTTSATDGEVYLFSHACSTDARAADLPGSPEFPNYDKCMSMPNAYIGEIKEGAYIPLKLTKTCQQWRSRADLQVWVDSTIAPRNEYATLELDSGEETCSFPFAGLPFVRITTSGAPDIAGSPVHAATSPLLSDIVAHVCGRNISTASALTFTFRVGIEAQVEPGTTLSPYQKVSPQYDSKALKAYFLVARELKDAYPVSYNDLGHLWDTISAASKYVLPLVRDVPILGPVLQGGVAVGDAIRAATRSKQMTRADGASAAAADRKVAEVRKVMEAVLKTPFRPLPAPQKSKKTAAKPKKK